MSQIILCVPGPWETSGDLLQALARGGPEYIFAGRVFMEMKTQATCELQLAEPDGRMREAFEIAGQGRIPAATLDAVADHRSIVYLLFDEPGYETARTAARFARALLEAGGIAVKVESAGVAHSRERWMEAWASEDPFDIYSLYVALVGGEGRYFSCGMHNFALPDAAVPASIEIAEAARLLNVFNLFQLVDSPVLNDGETFSADADAPRFRLKREPYEEGYDPGEPLHNPRGLWSLQPADAPPAKKRWRWGFGG